MLFKRSFFFYFLLTIILFKVNFDVIHYYRLGYLRHVYQVPGKGKDIPAAIVYYDYFSRVDPTDITAWNGLVKSHLANHDSRNAHKAIIRALHITPKDHANYPILISRYDALLKDYPIQ